MCRNSMTIYAKNTMIYNRNSYNYLKSWIKGYRMRCYLWVRLVNMYKVLKNKYHRKGKFKY